MAALLGILLGLLALRWWAMESSSAPYTGTSKADFIAWLGPMAQAQQVRTGLPASVLIAQAAQENGWAGSELMRRANNLHGIKAFSSWTGPVISASTWEERNGVKVPVKGTWRIYPNRTAALADGAVVDSIFRYYPTPEAGVRGYAEVIYRSGLYEAALAYRRDAFTFAALVGPSWATHSAYVAAVHSIMRSNNLTALDVPFERWNLDAAIVPPRHMATWAAAVSALQEQQA